MRFCSTSYIAAMYIIECMVALDSSVFVVHFIRSCREWVLFKELIELGGDVLQLED